MVLPTSPTYDIEKLAQQASSGYGFNTIKPNPPPEDWSERVVDPIIVDTRDFNDVTQSTWQAPPLPNETSRGNVINPGTPEYENRIIDTYENPVTSSKISARPDIFEAIPIEKDNEKKNTGETTKGLIFTEHPDGSVTINPWEAIKRFMQTGDEKAAFNIAATLSGLGTAFGGVKGGLGSAGGKPPLTVIEGGVSKQERLINDLTDKMVEAVRKGEWTEEAAKNFEKQLKELKQVSKNSGQTSDSKFAAMQEQIKKEVDDDIRSEFRILSGGRDPNKPVTIDNIVEWLKDAGAENVTVQTKGENSTTYIKFGPENDRKTVRVPSDDHPQRYRPSVVDTAGTKNWQEMINQLMQRFKLE